MNFSTYASIYAKFHGCRLSTVHNNIIVLDFMDQPWETWIYSRMINSNKISIDANQPLLQAMKAHYKTDGCASVFYQDSWIILLGNERIIYPIVEDKATLHLYATPYFVKDPNVVRDYLDGVTSRPIYNNVYFYKNTVLYLDNKDIPYPGGSYYDSTEASKWYRICFLTSENKETVCKLASEWKSRDNVEEASYLSKEARVMPKFIDYKPSDELNFGDARVKSTGIIEKRLSLKVDPNYIIQDILASYYKNNPTADYHVGLVLQWPLLISYEGTRLSTNIVEEIPKYVALSVNERFPNTVLYVRRPYDRYIEYYHVPATIWCPMNYVPNIMELPPKDFSKQPKDVTKVVLNGVVIGFVYNKAFFCLNYPLIEGYPNKTLYVNTEFMVSPCKNLEVDNNLTVIETFRYNDKYSLHRVNLKSLEKYELWCLATADKTHAYPKNVPIPYLVKMWASLFVDGIKGLKEEINPKLIRLARTLAKHKICFEVLEETKDSRKKGITYVYEDGIKIYTNADVIDFINSSRLQRVEDEVQQSEMCTIS